jgi:hypothetical protein
MRAPALRARLSRESKDLLIGSSGGVRAMPEFASRISEASRVDRIVGAAFT